MFVLGTAGHIDHGKSVLVKALTGIDPDRLNEEKARGMTIDLGFAWLRLPSKRELGIVDVPGHERFIKNMLAGVGGIDLALLVVAANEGVMPQTREHLAILDLLGINKAVVALTKKDLVDEDWLDLVKVEVEELLEPTTLSQAPIVAVSALTGEGLPELVQAIVRILNSSTPREDIGRPRLPIDRVFTISGSGTIVTGTLIGGSLSVGEEVEIVPAGLRSRLRGLQMHRSRLDAVKPGSRVAANLVSISTSEVKRGDVLTTPGWLEPTRLLTARLKLISYLKRPLKQAATLSFHTGTAETQAKARLLEADELKPGETGWVQLKLLSPLAVVNGDHFIVRSPMETLGGGRILDSHPRRLRRFRAAVIENLRVREKGSSQEVILSILESKQPLDFKTIMAQSDLSETEAKHALEFLTQEGKIVAAGEGENRLFFTKAGWENLKDKARAMVEEYHHSFATRPGMPKAELASKLKLKSPYPLTRLISEGFLTEEGANVRLPSHRIRLAPQQQAKVEAFLKSLASNPYSPPTDQIPEPDLVNLLVRQGQVVRVAPNIIFAASAYDEMVEKVTSHLREHGTITLAQVRDLFQTSRKYAQAFLEYLDQKRITRRIGDERVLYQKT